MRALMYCLLLLGMLACDSENSPYNTIQGTTMGTTYSIIMQARNPQELKVEIDDLLLNINAAVSTYEEEAIIAKFNSSYNDYLLMVDHKDYNYFIENFEIAADIYSSSSGAFDATVMPIVNYWGFGYTGKNKVTNVDSIKVDSIMRHVGFEKLTKKERVISKRDPAIELDFSGVAKGYAVDKISAFLEKKNIANFYVEIGGELFAKGKNPNGVVWRTGVSIPQENSLKTDFQQIIEVADKGIATSGNYRNYYESDGEVFSHTINPRTGYPERSKLLSATIIAPSCAVADGFATACMVLGLDKSIEMINLHDEIEAILIYDDGGKEFQVYDSSKK